MRVKEQVNKFGTKFECKVFIQGNSLNYKFLSEASMKEKEQEILRQIDIKRRESHKKGEKLAKAARVVEQLSNELNCKFYSIHLS